MQTSVTIQAPGRTRTHGAYTYRPHRPMMVIGSAVGDPDGTVVELTEERWSHIVDRHPEMRLFRELVLRAVREPDQRMQGRQANEEWCYLRTQLPSDWLKVVIAYAGGRGHIVTAHATKSTP